MAPTPRPHPIGTPAPRLWLSLPILTTLCEILGGHPYNHYLWYTPEFITLHRSKRHKKTYENISIRIFFKKYLVKQQQQHSATSCIEKYNETVPQNRKSAICVRHRNKIGLYIALQLSSLEWKATATTTTSVSLCHDWKCEKVVPVWNLVFVPPLIPSSLFPVPSPPFVSLLRPWVSSLNPARGLGARWAPRWIRAEPGWQTVSGALWVYLFIYFEIQHATIQQQNYKVHDTVYA